MPFFFSINKYMSFLFVACARCACKSWKQVGYKLAFVRRLWNSVHTSSLLNVLHEREVVAWFLSECVCALCVSHFFSILLLLLLLPLLLRSLFLPLFFSLWFNQSIDLAFHSPCTHSLLEHMAKLAFVRSTPFNSPIISSFFFLSSCNCVAKVPPSLGPSYTCTHRLPLHVYIYENTNVC